LSKVHVIENENNQVFLPFYTLSELADKYGDSVFRFCKSLTYSKEDAEDLFQETFLKIFEQPIKIKNSENPRNFLFSVALYTWKNWKRKYARHKKLAPTEPFDENIYNIASETNTEEDFAASEEIRIVRKLVGELPEKFKIPVALYYSAEMGIKEIAETLQIPEGTVKTRLFKARKIIEKGLIELE